MAWHGRDGVDKGRNDPILSCDAHPGESVLATGGADKEVKLWKFELTRGNIPLKFKYVCGLPAHLKSVNVVRWSPNGRILATGSDDGTVCLWRHVGTSHGRRWWDVRTAKDLSRLFLRAGASAADIYDIAWAPDSDHLVSGSINNTVHIWAANRGTLLQTYVEEITLSRVKIQKPLRSFFPFAPAGLKTMLTLYRALRGTHTTSMWSHKAAIGPLMFTLCKATMASQQRSNKRFLHNDRASLIAVARPRQAKPVAQSSGCSWMSKCQHFFAARRFLRMAFCFLRRLHNFR